MKTDQAKAASEIKKYLKSKGLKCSVRSESASMMSAVRVNLYNIPPKLFEEIEDYCKQYQYGHFDSMDDSYNYLNNRKDIPQAKYITVSNNWSDDWNQLAWTYIRENCQDGMEQPELYENLTSNTRLMDEYAYTLVYRLLRNSFSGISENFWAIHEPETTKTKPLTVQPCLNCELLSIPGARIEEHTHTKKGFQMWIVILAEKVERDEYLTLLDKAKSLGGWYSWQWKTIPGGFAFKDQDRANEFLAFVCPITEINCDSGIEATFIGRTVFDKPVTVKADEVLIIDEKEVRAEIKEQLSQKPRFSKSITPNVIETKRSIYGINAKIFIDDQSLIEQTAKQIVPSICKIETITGTFDSNFLDKLNDKLAESKEQPTKLAPTNNNKLVGSNTKITLNGKSLYENNKPIEIIDNGIDKIIVTGKFNAKLASPNINLKLSTKLQTMAEKLQPAIANKFADRNTNTQTRLGQAMSARMEGEKLLRTQKALTALADLHNSGNCPASLAKFTTKASVYNLMSSKHNMIPNGYHSYYVCTGEIHPTLANNQDALALWALLKPRSEQDIKAEKLKDKINNLQFSNIPGYFSTSEEVIDKMIDYAEIEKTDIILEPNLGSCSIADRACLLCEKIEGYEVNYTLAEICQEKGFLIERKDFLTVEPCEKYDKILMNPPFEKGQDIAHIKHAISFLKPGGILVAICANGPRQKAEFESVVDVWEDLPAGSFKHAGTGVNTALIVIEIKA